MLSWNRQAGLKELTKTERTVFDLYLDGKSANEIADVLNIRESTLKFHNHNILEKLGVSSRKQMLRYATLLKQESQNGTRACQCAGGQQRRHHHAEK